MNDVDTKITRKLPKELIQRALGEEAVTVRPPRTPRNHKDAERTRGRESKLEDERD